jgi:hypothetical protein
VVKDSLGNKILFSPVRSPKVEVTFHTCVDTGGKK